MVVIPALRRGLAAVASWWCDVHFAALAGELLRLFDAEGLFVTNFRSGYEGHREAFGLDFYTMIPA